MPEVVDRAIGTAKFMPVAIWGADGFHLLDLILAQCRFHAQYFMKHIMASLVQTVFPQGRTRYTPRLNVHINNCCIHFSKVMEQFSSRISCCMLSIYLMVQTGPRRTSGHSGLSRLDSLAETSPSPKNYSKAFENFWTEFLLGN
jgi:hypothetical protein